MVGFWSVLLCLFASVNFSEGGECCKAHLNLLASDQAEKWCPNYCCFHIPNLYDCCDDILFRAPEEARESFCLAYFTSNVWLPIIIAVGGLALIIGCCVCCCKCCCGQTRHGVIVQQQSQPGMVVVQQSATYNQVPTSNDPYRTGYIQ